MTVKIYGLQMSTCVRRVLATLEEKGVPYEIVVVDIMKGEHKTPEFLARQPFGQIPVVEDGDVTMFESRAIVRYFATKYADQGTELLGKDAAAKVAVDTWVEVESNHYNKPVSTIVYELVFKAFFGHGAADDAVVAAEKAKLETVLDVYEAILKTRAYLAGPEISIADLSHLSYTQYLVDSGFAPFAKHPAVQAWWDKISSRPSWKKITAK